MTAPEFPVPTLANLANLAKQTLERAREEPPALAPTEEASINARLNSITETDPGIRGEILERARTDPQARAALLREALGLVEPPPPEGIRYATEERLADTRRTCAMCRELTPAGYCRAAARGELAHAAREMRPDPARLHRCAGYRPDAQDADTRPGAARWIDQPRLRGHAA